VLLPRLAAVGAVAAGWALAEPHLPVLRRVRVPVLPAGWAPLRVLHLSDLHLLPRHLRRSAWIRDLAALEPDLVVSTGDHLSSAAAVDLLVQTLGALTADGTPGVFVPGNNDYYSPVRPSLIGYLTGAGGGPRTGRAPDLPWERVAALLVGAGWTDLTHRRETLHVGGRPVVLTGTDDAHLRRHRYGLVSGPVDGFGIGVTHTPQRALLRAYERDGHALVLAGHTHGGQLRVPWAGPLVTNCDLQRSRARGLTRGEGGWLHVSAGLGSSPYLPVRFCCRPEATLLDLVASS
jgi:predicted MPP superfamily phosphohydrolase